MLNYKAGKNIIKEKAEWVFTIFKSEEGRIDFIFGGIIWAFIIVRNLEIIFGTIRNFFSFITIPFIHYIVSYWVFSVFSLFLGLTITFLIINFYRFLKKFFKNFV